MNKIRCNLLLMYPECVCVVIFKAKLIENDKAQLFTMFIRAVNEKRV